MKDSQTVAALVAFAGLLLTQALLHRRWTREQSEDRRAEAERQARERREEQTQILARMAEQNSSVVNNALKVAEVHQVDAEKARLLALENAQAHAECREEVANLAARVEELRTRMVETERTAGMNAAATERHRDLKHRALNALTVADGYVALVQRLVPNCTCDAFAPLNELTNTVRPRVEELLAENRAIAEAED